MNVTNIELINNERINVSAAKKINVYFSIRTKKLLQLGFDFYGYIFGNLPKTTPSRHSSYLNLGVLAAVRHF